MSRLRRFVEMHDHFAIQWAEEWVALCPDSPFTFQHRSHPQTFTHFTNVFLQAYNAADQAKQSQWQTQLQESDGGLALMIVDLGILQFLQDPTIDIELLSRQKVEGLAQRIVSANVTVLYEKILHGKDLPEGSVELEIYKGIGQIRSDLDRKKFTTLTHALFLHLCIKYRSPSQTCP